MDDIARFNKERWEALARANIEFSRPALDLDEATARRLDPHGRMMDPAGRDVLCLAGGGGQQSAAFALLGGNVTVLDLCETQLDRDREAATHYGVTVTTVQGDMRDLSRFDDDSFDLVYQPISLGFVPDVGAVYDGVRRVIRPGGQYRLGCGNPFTCNVKFEEWSRHGYPIRDLYGSREVEPYDWGVWDDDGNETMILGPREFVHTFDEIVNGLIDRGFVIRAIFGGPDLGTFDCGSPEPNPEPGRWDHFLTVAPQYLVIWTACRSSEEGDSPSA